MNKKELIDEFCSQYAKIEKCSATDVKREIERQDPIFLRMFEIFSMGFTCGKEQKTCIVKDEDCHKYKIPVYLKEKFQSDCEKAYQLADKGDESLIQQFEDDFGKYRVN